MNHVVTMCFAPSRILRAGLEKFYGLHDSGVQKKHWLVDQHYPLRREENRKEILALCEEFGVNYLDPGMDMGLHRGLNWMMDQTGVQAGDVLLGYDPDSWPEQHGFDAALISGIQSGFAVSALMTEVSQTEFNSRGFHVEHHKGLEIIVPHQDCMFSITGWDVGFLRSIGGFHEENAYYGGLEVYIGTKLREKGRRIGYLKGFSERPDLNHLADPEYKAYKHAHAHAKSFTGSFAAYLEHSYPRQPVLGLISTELR